MKNNMVFIVSFFTLFTQAMESENSFSITAYGIKISLHKGDMVQHYAYDKGTEDIVICTGRMQNAAQYYGRWCPPMRFLGKYWKTNSLDLRVYEGNNTLHNIVYVGLWNASRKDQNLCTIFARKGIYFRSIEEPRLSKDPDKNFNYARYSKEQELRGESKKEYYGDEAIEEYLEDVSLCYKIVLNQEKLLISDIKNIAISAFGAGFEYYENVFAPKERLSLFTIKAILEYIKSSPRAYSCIELFIQEGFDLYKKALMEQYYELTAKVCLFLLAHQDSTSTLLVLPCDLIHYITTLISHN